MEFEDQKIVIDFRRCEILMNNTNPKYNYCLGKKYAILIGIDYLNDENSKRKTRIS